ncbi:unnamed protein product [Rhizophagus irregularis]|nr:unnamed protein product [Rhizophagus irregularis]
MRKNFQQVGTWNSAFRCRKGLWTCGNPVALSEAWEFATFWLFGHGDFDDPSPLNRQFFSSDTYFGA